MSRFSVAAAAAALFALLGGVQASACTGITLKPADGSKVLARTIEWGGSDLGSMWVIVPRGHEQPAYLPSGDNQGPVFTARYGYVGLAVQQKEFVAEGLNEKGLSAGLFYFPAYGRYEDYNPELKATTISDLQLVSWVLGNCASVDEVVAALDDLHVVGIDPRASTVHWRFADPSGRQVVLEIIDGKHLFYEDSLGVLTNSPSFDWQLTNLNNYVNLFPGSAPSRKLGDINLSQFGAGSGFLGIPGDVTPPSRFVRAAFYQATAPVAENAGAAVLQAFQILNNFDIPVGIEIPDGQQAPDIPSATQWTSATDICGGKIYYRTMRNSAIRCIDLNHIDLSNVNYHCEPLDTVSSQPIQQLVPFGNLPRS